MKLDNVHSSRLLRLADVCAICGLSRASIYRLIASRRFPPAVKIGAASRWAEDEVAVWIADRVRERDASIEENQGGEHAS